MDKPFALDLYRSTADMDRGDCLVGLGFATLEEARAALADFIAGKSPAGTEGRFGFFAFYASGTRLLRLTGPGVDEVVKNPHFRPLRVGVQGRAEEVSESCMPTISLSVRSGRRQSELFTSTTLEHAPAFETIVAALRTKGFSVEVTRFELTNTVCLTVGGLRSDKAVSYVHDIVRRAGAKAGFSFLSTSYR
jgi:hypothetical protein